MTIQEILENGTLAEQKALFQFDSTDSDEAVLLKFNLWGRHFFAQYYKVRDADFHRQIDQNNLAIYRGKLKSFVDLAFRGASKTTRTKLFIAFVIANDIDKTKRYIKILSHDITNCRQFTTDVYNMLIDPLIKRMYPEIFEKTETKREETMGSFTTATGIKMLSDTVGSSQRGAIQEDSRPDIIIFDDFETRETLRSAVKTRAIWDNMQEAKDGLAYNGGCIYLGNYISEMGNVHRLVENQDKSKAVLIIPIIQDGIITWPARYKMEDIDFIRKDSDDFEGEYLCKPSASMDIYFDREMLEKMEVKLPIKEIANFKMFKEYNPSHRYALGADVAGGVGLDSSTTVIIDFDTIPAQVVGTFRSNTIQPESHGDECADQSFRFGECIVAIENNKYDQAVLKAKLRGANLYKTGGNPIKAGYKPALTYGWNTNSLTKSKMFSAFKKAVEDGLVALNDRDLIQEAKSYSRNDLIDREEDARLTTRHFDLLTAACIAWQMKDRAEPRKPVQDYGIIRQSMMDREENIAL